MTELEREAIDALCGCSLQAYSASKRFIQDMAGHSRDPQYHLTNRQAVYLWQLVHMHRRQITSVILRRHGEAVHREGKLTPELESPTERRAPVEEKRATPRPTKKTKAQVRYEEELERGGGKLKL